jgi:hypothetical protein
VGGGTLFIVVALPAHRQFDGRFGIGLSGSLYYPNIFIFAEDTPTRLPIFTPASIFGGQGA